MTTVMNAFEMEMYQQLLIDLQKDLGGTERRNEKARWLQGYKSGRKNERDKIRDAIIFEMCGYGKTGCECDRCQVLTVAIQLIGGVADV